jgi:hypothetical protein
MKLIRAKAKGEEVTAIGEDNNPLYIIPNIKIMGNALGTSDGFVICDNEKWYYIPLIATDIKELLEKILNGLNEIKSSFSQVASSVTASKSTAPGSPIVTTITADLQPLIESQNNIIGELQKLSTELK